MGRSGKPLHFKGSAFHRVIPNFMCQVTNRSCLLFLCVLPTRRGPPRLFFSLPTSALALTFPRPLPPVMQGGDFTNHNGTGGKSIYVRARGRPPLTSRRLRGGLWLGRARVLWNYGPFSALSRLSKRKSH